MKNNTNTPLSGAFNWAAAALLCIILGSAWQLDGPSDLDVMQQVADEVAALEQSNKLVLAGQP
jgi:hypothetical protein